MDYPKHILSQRIDRLQSVKKKGCQPYAGGFSKPGPISALLENFKEGLLAVTAGRIMAIRSHGKSAFLDLCDYSGKIQVYVQKGDENAEVFDLFCDLDIGDIVGVKGQLFKTRTGEITIKATRLKLLSKNLRPLPEKWHGLKDIETRFRQRYVDLIMNNEVRQTFLLRSKIITQIRAFLDIEGFLEVETPMMQPVPGGAAAEPFETYHNALGVKLFLRVAPELYLKRLLVGGFEKVYEINRNFRNEGLSTRHNPEFTMLEVYKAFADYTDMMDLTERLIIDIAKKLFGGAQIKRGDIAIELSGPWKRISIYDALKEHTDFDFRNAKDSEVKKLAGKLNVEFDKGYSTDEIMNKVFEKVVEPRLMQPVFIVDYPVSLCPLAKRREDEPRLSERFELFIGTQEIANAYTELNDPLEQRRRFEEDLANKGRGTKDDRRGTIDEDFLRALEYAMPPAGGLGIGIDRLVMLFADKDSIREVILFPQLRPEQ